MYKIELKIYIHISNKKDIKKLLLEVTTGRKGKEMLGWEENFSLNFTEF